MPSELSPTTHFFTVDVEEYFQVRALESVVSRDEWLTRPNRIGRNIDGLLASLERHAVRGTFFVLGWIAKHRPEVVRAIARMGQDVAAFLDFLAQVIEERR
jgi:peptidoglycan/xylan/chitin deacetylase (PgdA/CDA1 family)